jgi:hypothetical protein
MKPWFAEYIKGNCSCPACFTRARKDSKTTDWAGAFVKVSIGVHPETREPKYRLAEVLDVVSNDDRKYKLEKDMTSLWLSLARPDGQRLTSMDKVSNSKIEPVSARLL